jgi:hypothetical protein
MHEAELRWALEQELERLLGSAWSLRITVSAPREAVAGECFTVGIRLHSGVEITAALPCGLAIGYLGDEENAVDAWKAWVEALAARAREAGA